MLTGASRCKCDISFVAHQLWSFSQGVDIVMFQNKNVPKQECTIIRCMIVKKNIASSEGVKNGYGKDRETVL